MSACTKLEPSPTSTSRNNVKQTKESDPVASRPAITYTVSELISDFQVMTWTDHEIWSSSPVQTRTSTETIVPADPEIAKSCSGKVRSTKLVQTQASGDDYVSQTHNCIDETGFSHFAIQIPAQNVAKIYPPKYELLTSVAQGMAWSGQHGEEQTRSCMVTASRRCDDGVATVCVTESAGNLTWLRQHYCQSAGWRGYEAVMTRNEDVFMRAWSSGLIVDAARTNDAPKPTDLPDTVGIREDMARIRAKLGH